ncbi:hypothetical protein FHY55_13005 [Oceanicola sp. D3]|uniref:hypothetical protein n=1 Tax=Oceanicola sp. D3 TaxID=2587163 RepID=UPI001124A2CE|nr:hypothetical protein [Oceanicola sp. D3]QDC10109.1 hypothetical protein FHY55_13005 [Oceanicola sp. D3]
MTNQPIEPSLAMIEHLLAHPDISRHIAGLKRLRVAVTAEAGAVSGHGRAGGTDLVVTGPVDAEIAEEAFHITRVIPRDGGHLRLDFAYPPADLSGSAEVNGEGQIVDVETSEG